MAPRFSSWAYGILLLYKASYRWFCPIIWVEFHKYFTTKIHLGLSVLPKSLYVMKNTVFELGVVDN